jgi:hypothetical protein
MPRAKSQAAKTTDLMPRPKPQVLRSQEKKARFLDAYREHGTINKACKVALISRNAYYHWTNPKLAEGKYYDEEFSELCIKAHEEYCDVVRNEIHRRAIEGWEEPVFGSLGFQQGSGQIGTVTRFSDRLLELQAKRVLPELQKPDSPLVNIDQRAGASAALHGTEGETLVFDPRKMTTRQRALFREMLAEEGGRLIEGKVVEG